MSARAGSTVVDPRLDGSPQIASSAVVLGVATMGYNSGLSQGAIVCSTDGGVVIGTRSLVIENSVVVGYACNSVAIGLRTVLGHRCMMIGATVGDLCEIGNASVFMPGAQLGDRGVSPIVAATASSSPLPKLELLVPSVANDEFERNRPRAEDVATSSVLDRFRQLRKDLHEFGGDERMEWFEEDGASGSDGQQRDPPELFGDQ
jgi:carbonic anhydrase/acetyltransferase-like protein (isoleucine patch superfamily)